MSRELTCIVSARHRVHSVLPKEEISTAVLMSPFGLKSAYILDSEKSTQSVQRIRNLNPDVQGRMPSAAVHLLTRLIDLLICFV